MMVVKNSKIDSLLYLNIIRPDNQYLLKIFKYFFTQKICTQLFVYLNIADIYI